MSTSSTPSPETLSGPETVAIARTPSGRDRETAGLSASPSRVPRLLQGRQLRCVYFISRQTDFQQISVTTVIASRGQASRQPSEPAGPACARLEPAPASSLAGSPRGLVTGSS